MTDQTIMDNYLLLLKSTTEVYIHGTLESSHENPREILKNSLFKILTSQATTYEEMTKRGWYTIENVKAKEIEKILAKISNN